MGKRKARERDFLPFPFLSPSAPAARYVRTTGDESGLAPESAS